MSEYVIDFSGLNTINNNFFGIDDAEEVINDYEDQNKIDLCNNFENQLINKLTDLGKNDIDAESALRSFMSNFKDEAINDSCTTAELTDYFKTILSAIDNMTDNQIDNLIKCVKNQDLRGLFNVFGEIDYHSLWLKHLEAWYNGYHYWFQHIK